MTAQHTNDLSPLPQDETTFSDMIGNGFYYADKTDMVHALTHESFKFIYLSRPRRFGKSLLVDVLDCYFLNQRHLFKGLMIDQLEPGEWKQHEVLRLDMSKGGDTEYLLLSYLNSLFSEYERKLGLPEGEREDYVMRFSRLVNMGAERSRMGVVILVDEYDSVLQHTWNDRVEHDKCRRIYKNLFGILKSDARRIHFCFITGTAKFSQVSIFSALNNLVNISFLPEYQALCGITQRELDEQLTPWVQRMADRQNWTLEQTYYRLKQEYDGYHFTCEKGSEMLDIYNPFSLLRALVRGQLSNDWGANCAASAVSNFVKDAAAPLSKPQGFRLTRVEMETSDVNSENDALFLYQAGFLTIKDADETFYHLVLPNMEVRKALGLIVVPAMRILDNEDKKTMRGRTIDFMKAGEVDNAVEELCALVAATPFGNVSLKSMKVEERYRFVVSTLLAVPGIYLEVERHMSGGIIDLAVDSGAYVYVFEFKLAREGGAADAAQQIVDRGYLTPYYRPGKTVYGIGLELENRGRGLRKWVLVEGDHIGEIKPLTRRKIAANKQ